MDHKVSKDMISSGMIPSGEKTQADLGRTQYGSAPSPSKLMDAYKSMYDKKEEVINEHHKKDADGNTIPHEGEELNEGKMPEGLKKYLEKKNAKKEDKKEMKEENIDEVAPVIPLLAMGGKALATKLALKGAALGAKTAATKALATKGVTAIGSKVGAAALKTATKAGTMAGKLKSAGGIKGVASKGMRSAGKAIKDNPVNTALVGTMAMPSRGGSMPQRTGGPVIGQYNDVDLFDLVKGQLLDEGIDEKDALKIMVELSQEDLKKIIDEGKLANIARLTAAGAVATMGADAINKQLQNQEKMKQGGKFKKGSIMDTIQKKNQMMQGM